MIGSPGLVLLALFGQPSWVGFLAAFLVLTEWLDGFLARRLHEVSMTGARLDTVADALFYLSLLAAVALLSPTMTGQESLWIAVATASYLCSWLASWIKFRRLPSYHTWAAKGVWLVVGTGILCLLAGWSPWPFRIATICVVLTNLEAIAITLVLSACKVNVSSVWHVLRTGKGACR
jgi:phosphatidylglycerophosphate synthase